MLSTFGFRWQCLSLPNGQSTYMSTKWVSFPLFHAWRITTANWGRCQGISVLLKSHWERTMSLCELSLIILGVSIISGGCLSIKCIKQKHKVFIKTIKKASQTWTSHRINMKVSLLSWKGSKLLLMCLFLCCLHTCVNRLVQPMFAQCIQSSINFQREASF